MFVVYLFVYRSKKYMCPVEKKSYYFMIQVIKNEGFFGIPGKNDKISID